MRKVNKLIMTVAIGAAVFPAAVSAQVQQTLELKRSCQAAETPAKVPFRAPADASYKTRLVGFLYYAESWNDLQGTTPMGIYTLDVVPGAQPEPFARIGVMNSHCNGGAVLAGDVYWYIWRQTAESDTQTIDISQLYSYNIKTGEFQNHGHVSSELASNSDHAWDPVENKIYGQYTLGNARKLCVVDYLEQTVTPVGDCYSYYGLAFDAAGQLWGIDSAGDLYKVNKNNGSATRVGSTGVVPKYAQSMAFDFKTGDLYWASLTDADVRNASKLYKVDTATGRATLVTSFTDNQEFMGLGVMPAIAPDNAPGYVTGLKLDIDKASTNGTLTFTLPAYTYMGDDLEGEVSYAVKAGDRELFSGKGEKGSTVSQDVSLPNGDVTVNVICSNSEGEGPAASLQVWVGEDYPVAPKNVRLSIEEATGCATLTWNAVTEGTHGGYIDPAKMTYSVTRMPDGKNVASALKGTSFSETLAEPDLPVDYYYQVKAVHDWRESETAESTHVPYGKGFEVPYHNPFDDETSMNLFYVTDGNNDGSTWKWSKHQSKTAYIFTGTDFNKPQDDWLITPGIDMKAGNRYELTYTVCANMNDGRFLDRMEVKYGKGIDPSKYAVAEEAFESVGKQVQHRVIVEPAEDGYYHFGFHAISNCVVGLSIEIDDMHIDVLANGQAPGAVTGLSVKTSQGTAPVTIKFTTPTKKVNGESLDKITKVEVYRNTSELVKTVEMTETGKAVTVVDNKGARGLTEYTVVAYNEHGVGDRATVTTYLGLDLPGAARDILLTDLGNGRLKLSWQKPLQGANGGYCDPNNLTYNVYAVQNGYATEFKSGIRGTELEFTDNDYYSRDQFPKFYGLSAVNSVGESSIYQSSEVMVGQPYAYPFKENWPTGSALLDGWYRMSNGQNGWEPESGHDSDGDNGCIAFDAAQDGDLSYLALGKVNMAYAAKPKLIFDYYAVPGADMSILPEINLAYTGEYAAASAIDFKTLTGEAGWRTAVVDLSSFLGRFPYLSVRFLGKGSTSSPLRIDNVRIMDSDAEPTLDFSGIDDITVNDGNAVYYDLLGRRVARPAAGNIYIRRSASGKTDKIIY